MKRTLIFLLSCISFLSCKTDQTPGVDPFQTALDSIYTAFPNTKGISVHIEAPEQGISWSGAAGWADSASNRKLNANDPAIIASMTKTYMAAAILRLVEDSLISLTDPISQFIPSDLDSAFRNKGYNTDSILIEHLCTHTSGIYDYVNVSAFTDRSTQEPGYEWTRREQLDLIFGEDIPVNPVGQQFAYSDANHVLLGMVLEKVTRLDFYTALRKLLRLEELGLNQTWWYVLEEQPKSLSPVVHQFATKLQVDNYTLSPSFDMYGGGGLASTPTDAAQFTQALFSGDLFDNPKTAKLLYHTVKTADGKENGYYLSIAKMELGKYTAYGHGGFWGTTMQYFPELDCSISVFLMERDEWPRYKILLEELAQEIDKKLNQIKRG